MKCFSLVAVLAGLLAWSVSAQPVTVELSVGQEQYLPGETLTVAAKITNRSGRQLHLGAEANWLTFNVESLDGFVVIKKSEVPVLGPFDLLSSQEATKRVDLAPCFEITKPGRYKITATMRVKDLSAEATSPSTTFDIIGGADLWNQDFGVPAPSGVPEMRKYTLEKATYVNSQMRLYVQVTDPGEVHVIKTSLLGQMVSFSQPEAQVDRNSVLHVLWQSGAQGFSYCQVNPDGKIIKRDTYDDMGRRPRLGVQDDGE
ncbi:MAG TPA: hypothetical protein VF607_04350, partial [Verrucomicrobiae bacterium]